MPILVAALVFLFPVVAMLIPHGPTSIFAILILAGVATLRRQDIHLSYTEKAVLIGFGLIFVAAALSLINAHDLSNSVSKIERYSFFVFIVPVYLLLRKYNDYIVWAFLLGLALSAVLIGLTAFWEVEIGDQLRASGIRHPIMFGSFAALVSILLLLGAVLFSKKWWQYALWLGPLIFATYATIESGTRNAMLALPITLTALLFLARGQVNAKGWIAVISLALLTGGSAVLFTDRIVSGFEKGIVEVQSYVEGDTQSSTSWGLRLNMWRNSLEVLKKHPVIGTGIGDYQIEMERLIESGFSHSADSVLYLHEAHSIYFHALAVSGSLGFLALVSGVVVVPLWVFLLSWKNAKAKNNAIQKFVSLAGVATIASFAVFGVGTAWQEKSTFLVIYLVFTTVLLAHACHPHSSGKRARAEI